MNVVPGLRRCLKLSARCFAVVALVSLVIFPTVAHSQVPEGSTSTAAATPTSAAFHTRAATVFAQLPLRFDRNQGQGDTKVKFVSRNGAYSLLLAPNEAVVALAHAKGRTCNGKGSGAAAHLLVDANPNLAAMILGIEELAAHATISLEMFRKSGAAKSLS